MKLNYRSPPISLVSNDIDVHYFIDGYEEATTDPPLRTFVEDFVDEMMDSIDPTSLDSKYFELTLDTEKQKEISEKEMEKRDDGYVNIITTIYKNDKYELTHKERNNECGASASFEVVLLAIISGAVGGIASTITSKLIDIYAQVTTALSTDEIHNLMHELLREKYGAQGNITCVSSKKDESERKYILEDERKNRFYIEFSEGKGIKSVKVRKGN